MKIQVWSDFVCPFCYMGERKFELALEKFAHKEEVELEFKSFELSMDSQKTKGKDIHQVIADKYGVSYAQAKANNDKIAQAAKEVGLNYRFDLMQLNNTLLAHEIAQYAKLSGNGNELIRQYFKGYFEEGMDIGEEEVLFQIAEKTGLNMNELKEKIKSGELKKAVREDEQSAQDLGINSVPHFIIDGKYAVSGAQDPALFLEALNQAYTQK